MKKPTSRKISLILLGLTIASLVMLLSANSLEALGGVRERIAEIRSQKTSLEWWMKRAIDTKEFIQVGKDNRFYLLHIPKSYNKAKWAPLVLAFHGGMGNAQNMKIGYDIQKKSDAEGFILAFPNGASRMKNGNFATWNAGTCCGFWVTSESDDIWFVKKIVEEIQTEYKVTKVFAMGMSNGAMFSYRLACEVPELFDAIGAVAGTDNTINCTPKETTPVIHIHALNDDHVLYEWGCGPKCIADSEPEFVSVPDTIEKWKTLNQCRDTPTRELSGSGVTCDVYRNCASWSPVKLCSTVSGGHSWPGNGNRANPRTGDKEPPSQAINATDTLWNFFQTVTLR